MHLGGEDQLPQVRGAEPQLAADRVRECGDAVHMAERLEVVVLDLVGQCDEVRRAAAVHLAEGVTHG